MDRAAWTIILVNSVLNLFGSYFALVLSDPNRAVANYMTVSIIYGATIAGVLIIDRHFGHDN